MVLDLNLNDLPPVDNGYIMSNPTTVSHTFAPDAELEPGDGYLMTYPTTVSPTFMPAAHIALGDRYQLSNPFSVSPTFAPSAELALFPVHATNNVEHLDDEVIICSPRSFAAARDKSRRNHGVIEVLDVENDYQIGHSARLSPTGNRRRKAPPNRWIGSGSLNINVEAREETESENVVMLHEVPQPVPQPKEPALICPICMGPFEEETSTKCGHIFCKKCIKAALAAQKKCPTCRQKLRVRDTLRIYLPTSK